MRRTWWPALLLLLLLLAGCKEDSPLASGIVELQFPLGGLDNSLAYQNQPPFTTPRCVNVRPRGRDTGRLRGGSRPGLVKAYADQLPLSPHPPGQPVRMLNTVSSYRGHTIETFSDPFSSSPMNPLNWVSAGWTGAGTVPNVVGGQVICGAALNPNSPEKRDVQLIDVDPNTLREVRITLEGARMAQPDFMPDSYFIYFGYSSDPFSDGLVAEMGMSFDYYYLLITRYESGKARLRNIRAFSYPFSLPGGFLRVDLTLRSSPDRSTLSWSDSGSLTLEHTPLASDRIGFGMYCASTSHNVNVQGFNIQYTPTLAELGPRSVVASAGGAVYYTDDAGSFKPASYSSGGGLGSDQTIFSAERFGKLYIADFGGYRAEGDGGEIFDHEAGADYSDFKDTDISDWRDVARAGDWLWITGATTNAQDTYRITAVDENYVTIDISGGAAEATIAWKIIRGAKIFDPLGGTGQQLVQWSSAVTYGSLPVGCPLIAAWNGRIVKAGGPVFPYAWWMSRFGDPLDWDYFAWDGDPGRAVFSQAASLNVIGEPITALIAFSDDYLVFGCENSLWLLRGDPGAGGVMGNLSQTVGVVSGGAWCAGPEGQVVFLSRDGLYELAPGGNSYPRPLSRHLPRELTDVDASAVAVQMAYDAHDYGLHIFLTPHTGGAVRHWWMNWGDRSFWPVSLDADHQPTAVTLAKGLSMGVSDVLLGGWDGYVRRFSDGAEDDDGETLASEVTIGPVLLGRSGMRGLLADLEAAISESAGSLGWEVYTGESPEAAFSASRTGSPNASGTWSQGMSHRSLPRAGGACFFLRLAGTETWELETIRAGIVEQGRFRKP